MVETKRKKRETFGSLIRRFNRKLIQSGRLVQARKVRFYRRPESEFKVRKDALRREAIKKKREYLKKIGKLKEEPRRGMEGKKRYGEVRKK